MIAVGFDAPSIYERVYDHKYEGRGDAAQQNAGQAFDPTQYSPSFGKNDIAKPDRSVAREGEVP